MKVNFHVMSNGLDIKNELRFLKREIKNLDCVSYDCKHKSYKDMKYGIKLTKELLICRIKLIRSQDELLNLRQRSGFYGQYVKSGYLIK